MSSTYSTSRINSIHPSTLILGDPQSAVQTRSKVTKSFRAHAFVNYIQKQRRNNHKDFQHFLFACFLSQNEPKKISEALEDKSWVDAMQEELLQFKIQKVWILVDLPYRKKAIGTKWVYRNKKDKRGVVVRNKARLVAQGHRQEEGVDYDEVFAHVARIEAIRIFLAFVSYMGFIVYQMGVKSAFLYGKIDEEVYVPQPPGFIDPKYPNKVYKVVKALYGLHQAPRAWYATLYTFLLKNGYRRGTINKTLFIKKDNHDIILVQVYVDDIIFGYTKKSWCDEFEALMKSRFQMSSMRELTFFLGLQVKQKEEGIFISQDKYVAEILKKFDFVSVIPKTSYLSAVKRIFRYLKGKPKLGLWYPRVSSFDLEAYSDSDYAGANLDRKSTIGEAEYVAAANCYRQVLWIQNQMLDYRFNFMSTKIYIDNESTICIVKNPVYHSKTKHIAIRHHFIRDAYEKKLIQVLKIHTDDNVADLLTRAFDVSSLGLTSEEAKDLEQKRLKKKVVKETPKTEDTAKVPAKVDVIEQGTKKRKGGQMKMLARKRKRSQSDVDSDDEHRKCLKIVTFEGTMDSEIMERKSVIARLNKVISPDGDYLVIYRANGNFRAFNCLLEVLHIFDRQDLFHLYDLVMEQYSEITLEGIELILWGDLKIMMESSQEENDQSDFWDDQQDWEIVTWRLMLDLGLEVERESTAALDLIRFIKQQIDEN
ncbi:putative ribonuclease H-like domain-containing protein [Tanacetum coccineum]